MNRTFYLVDDDKSVRRMLNMVITQHGLGQIQGEASHGTDAREDIVHLRPAIVLIDLLLPGMDGISLVAELKDKCPGTCFVMVSQVTDKEMISKAYLAGVDFFISKPINVVEVVSVLRQVQERMDMETIIESLRMAIGGVPQPAGQRRTAIVPQQEEDRREKLTAVLSRLGIWGESGSHDLVELCMLLVEQKGENPGCAVKMSGLYGALADRYAAEGNPTNTATIEQRIRRGVNKALNNLANLGIEDYSNEVFVSFGSAFFDFAEVRRQMNYIRGTGDTPGKISIKKFIEGLAMVTEREG